MGTHGIGANTRSRMAAVRRFIFTVLAAAVLACASAEERAEEAQARFRAAMEHGDRAEAIAAIEDLRASLPDTPESLLQVSQLQVQAGSAPDAGWLLEEGVRRFPERDELRLALGRVALLLGNPALAREAVLPVAADSEQHPARGAPPETVPGPPPRPAGPW